MPSSLARQVRRRRTRVSGARWLGDRQRPRSLSAARSPGIATARQDDHTGHGEFYAAALPADDPIEARHAETAAGKAVDAM
jgi:hypothetical protein